uniref:Uncharacterized protein n=1 Tax=Arion vulgaris TaxID=1028688 RepID=A0A0B7BMC9_9EUPU
MYFSPLLDFHALHDDLLVMNIIRAHHHLWLVFALDNSRKYFIPIKDFQYCSEVPCPQPSLMMLFFFYFLEFGLVVRLWSSMNAEESVLVLAAVGDQWKGTYE